MILEFCHFTCLQNEMDSRKDNNDFPVRPYTEKEIMVVFVQLCLATQALHSMNIMHQDLKPENIFLSKKGIVKIGDFGLSSVMDEALIEVGPTKKRNGTIYYMSPELVDRTKKFDKKIDVWAIGCILYEMAMLDIAFYDENHA